jgi:IS1 family transposase
MRRLSFDKRVMVAKMLVEGTSMRSIERVTGVNINTIMKLLLALGKACVDFHDRTVLELPCTRIEVDEVWSYIHTKEDHLAPEKRGTLHKGDSYTWIAIDPVSKFVPGWHVGKRTTADAQLFIQDLSERMANRIQITSDGFKAYEPAIAEAFGTEVDYAQLHNVFEKGLEGMSAADFLNKQRYVQPDLEATNKVVIFGNPDLETVGTSIIERHNRTVRMSVRRMSRAVDSFSKSYEHHRAALALTHVWYNFIRRHKTLRCTPAMEIGLAKTFWTMEQLVELQPAPVAVRPKTYKKRAA